MKVVEFIPESKICSYLNHKVDKFRYFYITNGNKSFIEYLISHGWRRFGNYCFTPICDLCDECVSIRVLVDRFVFSPRFKRVMNKNQNINISINTPSLSEEKIQLYNKYHFTMKEKKNWKYEPIDFDSYKHEFIDGSHNFGLEIQYRINQTLVGVGYADMLYEGLSATYFFYDHDYAKQSLGTFNILYQISLAKTHRLKYFYPGYYIKDHYAMGYKKDFTPFERLITPDIKGDISAPPIWVK